MSSCSLPGCSRCRLNSSISVVEHPTHLDSSNAVSIIKEYDVVLDCSDNLATRYLINDACAVFGPKPLVSGSALRLEGQMTVYFGTSSARAPCFRCLFPVPPPATTVHGCSEAGVFGVVPGIIGTMQAAEAIKLITGIGATHSGRLFILDMERNLTRTVQLRQPRPDCLACGEGVDKNPDRVLHTDYPLFCGAPSHDKPPGINLKQLNNRITVLELHEWRKTGVPMLLIDIRPKVEVDLCRLTPCLHFPYDSILRDSVISTIRAALDQQLQVSCTRPFPVVLLCHRGNKSSRVAPLLASALSRTRCDPQARETPSDNNNTDGGTPEVANCADQADAAPTDQPYDFVVCDVAGGLVAWASQVDPEFPMY